ncbi:squalene/phytoene synthase family protein [Microtetraspora sp. NBRC 16547]|uniref:phytoene/squalene synthase family protein n=1 Tax=Microtetraspora sp. NBRC 16547 TaxID=3030993 RepID=UPI0024A4C521|nr:squalene/phytoene synthase family protein [Microtetraspora sp. NBRC 16547]GLX01404.1 phytoene synthase [Microtetraspora sp. NBRC 16547]
MGVPEAYRHCEQIMRRQARNFSYGLRLLPAPKRRALSAVYAFARRIDDIADGHGPVGQRLAQLAAAREALDGPPELRGERDGRDGRDGRDDGEGRDNRDGREDLVLIALHDAARRYPLPLAAFGELIDGCAADVRGTTYARFDELLSYCRCVAGSIGRLSLGVFGTDDPAAATPLADALGVALQITNILRDVREDRLAGRIYLPIEDLERFGCTLTLDGAGRFTDPPHRLATLIRYEAVRAREWFADGMRLLPLLDTRSAACTAAMAGIYRCLLDRIAADPAVALSARLSLPPWAKAMVAARALAGAGR